MSKLTTRLANLLRIEWDPESDNGTVTYNIHDFIVVDGKASSFYDPRSRIQRSASIAETAVRMVEDAGADPITGTALQNISGAGVMVLIKRLTDQILAEIEAELTRVYYGIQTSSTDNIKVDEESQIKIQANYQSGLPADLSNDALTIVQQQGDPAAVGTILVEEGFITIPITLTSPTGNTFNLVRNDEPVFQFTLEVSNLITPEE